MSNQIRAEWYKLKRSKPFWVILLITTFFSALLHYLVIIEWWQMSGTPFEWAGLSEFNAISTFTVPLFFNLIISPLAGFFISNEFSQGSVIKNQMISGSKRTHIFLAKYLVFTLGSIILTIVIPVVIAIIEVILLGHGDILTSSSMLYLGRAYGLFALQFLGYTAIIILFAIVTEDSGKTIICTILFTMIMFAIDKFPNIPVIGMLYENSIFNQFNVVFNYSITDGEIVKAIIIALITFFVITITGIYIFNKKEIK